jgi:transposase
LGNPFNSVAPDVVTRALVEISHYAGLPRLEEYPFFASPSGHHHNFEGGVMAKNKKIKRRNVSALHIMQPHAAGIDIGATEIYVAVPNDRDETPVRRFETFTEDLHEAAKWLKSCKIESIAMESTGVYWIPIFQILDAYGFEVFLVNARHVKNVPGRKTDVLDCQWIQYLHSVGLLRGSFRPDQEICAVRSLLRHRDNMVKAASRHVQHMQKALTQMNLQIHNVISNICGVTGLAIIDAILAGERDPKKLADLRDRRIRAEKNTIIKSLVGDYRQEHLFTLKQALASYRHYCQLIEECDGEIEKLLREFESRIDLDENLSTPPKNTRRKPQGNEPKFDLKSHMHRILGTDLTKIDGISVITTHIIFSEIGPDLSKFPTVQHFCSWLGLCPNNKISGGKVLSSHTRPGTNRVAQALRIASQSLWNSRSYLGGYFRRLRARHGAPKAITATAHKLARVIYHLIKNQKSFDETIFADQEANHKKRLEQNLKKQAKYLGFQLVPVEPHCVVT